MESKLGEHGQAISIIFEYLKELEKKKIEESEIKNRKRIGFKSNNQS
jgi:hypothetical protein